MGCGVTGQEAAHSGESEALRMALGELIDDAALAHSGRSIGVLASYSVAGEVLEYLRSQGVIPPASCDNYSGGLTCLTVGCTTLCNQCRDHSTSPGKTQ